LRSSRGGGVGFLKSFLYERELRLSWRKWLSVCVWGLSCAMLWGMHEARRLLLRNRALALPETGSQLMVKVQAIAELVRANEPVPVDVIREELLAAASNTFGTYEADRAARMASRLLEFMDGNPELEWPSETPFLLAGPDYWPGRDDPFADSDLGMDTQGLRDEWRTRLMGPPPWKKRDSADQLEPVA
jgi:hypothetical protein